LCTAISGGLSKLVLFKLVEEGVHNVRFSLLCASAALASGLALSACSGSNTGSTPVQSLASSDGQVAATSQLNGHQVVTRLMPGVKRMATGSCPSQFVFCIAVIPGNPGPYVSTSAGRGYELYNNAYIEKMKTGKIDKKFDTYFYPDPGNPTSQYILFSGKSPKKTQNVKYADFYCIGFSPSSCDNGTYTFEIGIALTPAT
jgi:hypothetical protein